MKKMILFALVTLTFAACSKQDKYTVKGTADASLNGISVVFNKFEKGAIIPDTVVIEENAFTWTGAIDSSRMINAYVLTPEIRHFQMVLEKGDITVAVENGKIVVGGTPLNDIYQGYVNKEAEAYKSIHALSSEYQAKVEAGTVTEEETKAYNEKYASISNEFGKYSMDFIKANVTNPVGKTFFANRILYMGPKEKEEMLSFATDDLKAMYAPKK